MPSDEARRYVAATAPEHDEIQAEMADRAAERDFPIIGRDAGGLLRSLARATGARRIFEFGSGFGYSAYWFLQGMPEDGTIVLTEFDRDNVELAREFFERAGVADRATVEHGDAMETVERYDGPFDVVLIDHQKSRYADAFDAIRDEVPVGGVVVADNVMRGPVELKDLLAHFESGAELPDDASTRGIAEYLHTVQSDDDFHTVVLPVGNGLALTTRERA